MYFEDFCREVIHIRKKKQFIEVEKRKIAEQQKEEENKKKTVVSKGPPLRRLKSEIPSLESMRKRSNSILIKPHADQNSPPEK